MKEKITFLTAGFVAAALIFYFVGSGIGYQQGWQAAKEKVEATGLFLPTPEEIFAVSGEVKQIQDNAIIIQTFPLSLNPLEKQSNLEKTIKTTPDTKFVKLSLKTAEELSPDNFPLLPYNEEEISLSDIQPGDRITAEAKENIKEKASFEATKISVSGLPE